MSEAPDRFAALCKRVRFTLDTPGDREADGQGLVADFVGWVRSTGLLVTDRTVPAVHESVERVSRVLGLVSLPEVYVINDPNPNAFAPAFASSNRPIVVLNSGLVQLLGPNELAFTLGHELGHLGLGHGSLPRSQNPASEYHALQMRSRQRYAEISADRVGLLAARSVFTSAHVMVKLASGLPTELLGLDIRGFMQQIETDHLPSTNHAEWALSQTHPSLPLRLWALVQFSNCMAYGELTGQGAHGTPIAEVEKQVIARLDKMGDGRLGELEEQSYRKTLLWTATALVMDDDKIEEHEAVALRKLVGDAMAGKALQFARNNGRDAVMTKLEESAYNTSVASEAARQRVIQASNAFALSIRVDPDHSKAMQIVKSALKVS